MVLFKVTSSDLMLVIFVVNSGATGFIFQSIKDWAVRQTGKYGSNEWGSSYYVNNIKCNYLQEINKESLDPESVVHEIPDGMLKNYIYPRQYPSCNSISPWDLADANSQKNFTDFSGMSEKWMVIFVKSAVQNFKRRNAIRKTWARVKSIKGKDIFTVFVVAKSNNTSHQNALEQENKVFGDILQCDFIDSYVNLPLKVLSMMGWITSHDIPTKLLMITDDDVVVRLAVVYYSFMNYEHQFNRPNIYCGLNINYGNQPIRDENSKWVMPKEIYSGDEYPVFCNGPNYVMTKSMVKELFCAAAVTDYSGFYLEDVLITGIIREKLNKEISAHISFPTELIEYFWVQVNPVNLLIRQTWTSWLEWDHQLVRLLTQPKTIIERGNRDIVNVVGILDFWDK